jgi:hypothetical protein
MLIGTKRRLNLSILTNDNNYKGFGSCSLITRLLVDDKKRTEWEKLSNFIENILPLDLML